MKLSALERSLRGVKRYFNIYTNQTFNSCEQLPDDKQKWKAN